MRISYCGQHDSPRKERQEEEEAAARAADGESAEDRAEDQDHNQVAEEDEDSRGDGSGGGGGGGDGDDDENDDDYERRIENTQFALEEQALDDYANEEVELNELNNHDESDEEYDNGDEFGAVQAEERRTEERRVTGAVAGHTFDDGFDDLDDDEIEDWDDEEKKTQISVAGKAERGEILHRSGPRPPVGGPTTTKTMTAWTTWTEGRGLSSEFFPLTQRDPRLAGSSSGSIYRSAYSMSTPGARPLSQQSHGSQSSCRGSGSGGGGGGGGRGSADPLCRTGAPRRAIMELDQELEPAGPGGSATTGGWGAEPVNPSDDRDDDTQGKEQPGRTTTQTATTRVRMTTTSPAGVEQPASQQPRRIRRSTECVQQLSEMVSLLPEAMTTLEKVAITASR